jgi:hypothetical protein
MFAPDFIEERRTALEQFINKIAGHPLAQKEKCLHMFLQVLDGMTHGERQGGNQCWFFCFFCFLVL